MAMMMGQLHPDATRGEKAVFSALRARLPEDYQVWPELPVQKGDEPQKHPDFVILHPLFGITVLEVKDWAQVLSANPYKVKVRTRAGEERDEENPVTVAKRYCDWVADSIRETHRKAVHEGSFRDAEPSYARAWGVVLTLQQPHEITWLEERLRAKSYLITGTEVQQDALESRLRSLPRRGDRVQLSEKEHELLRRALFPEGEMRDGKGEFIGQLSPEQEIEVKAGIYPAVEQENDAEEEEDSGQLALFAGELPEPVLPDVEQLELTQEGQEIAERFSVRMVRGVAGSGKTQILCKRAILLAKLNPEWDILVLTRNKGLAADLRRMLQPYSPPISVIHFDKLCKEPLVSADLWRRPLKDGVQPGWIEQACRDVSGAERFDSRFLRDEFNWMKYTGNLDWETYREVMRIGREKKLPKGRMRRIVFQVFQSYQRRLQRYGHMDWAEVPLRMVDAMNDGLIPVHRYNTILVDEAQMFPPSWFNVVKHWLKPDGMLFMAADTTQNIYSRFSWKQKGLNVRGRRSRILRRPYRSSLPIAKAAFELIRSDKDLLTLIEKEGGELVEPQLDHPGMRAGERPKLVRCDSLEAELHYVANQVKELISGGMWPSDIAVLTLKERTQRRFAGHLHQQGIPRVLSSEYRYAENGPPVVVGLISGITGQEFKAVFVVDVQDLFDRDSPAYAGSWREFKVQQKRLLFVAMSRARDHLHICFRQKLHNTLRVLSTVMEKKPYNTVA